MTALARRRIDIEPIAEAALVLNRKIVGLTESLNDYKGTLRDYAGGDTTTIEVVGVGTVKVNKPSVSQAVTHLVVDEVKWAQLLDSEKQTLLEMGLVRYDTKVTPARAASVSFTYEE